MSHVNKRSIIFNVIFKYILILTICGYGKIIYSIIHYANYPELYEKIPEKHLLSV